MVSLSNHHERRLRARHAPFDKLRTSGIEACPSARKLWKCDRADLVGERLDGALVHVEQASAELREMRLAAGP